MRILLINTTEKIGGPAVAASRLMEALKNNGIKAKLLVRDKQTEQITVVELPHNSYGNESLSGRPITSIKDISLL